MFSTIRRESLHFNFIRFNFIFKLFFFNFEAKAFLIFLKKIYFTKSQIADELKTDFHIFFQCKNIWKRKRNK